MHCNMNRAADFSRYPMEQSCEPVIRTSRCREKISERAPIGEDAALQGSPPIKAW